MTAITENANRDALLRFLDLKNDLATIAERYQDLGLGVVSSAMKSAGYDVLACAFLPQNGYVVPPTADPAP